MRNNKNSTSPTCSKERTEQTSPNNKSIPKEKPSVNSSLHQSIIKYENHLGYFCKYINKINKDEFTDLTDLLKKIKKLDFSLVKRTSQLRPLVQLLNILQILTDMHLIKNIHLSMQKKSSTDQMKEMKLMIGKLKEHSLHQKGQLKILQSGLLSSISSR